MADWVSAFFAGFALLVAGIVWFVRLEGKVKAASDRIDAAMQSLALLREKHENLDSKIVAQLTQVRESLARIEGHLGFGTPRD